MRFRLVLAVAAALLVLPAAAGDDEEERVGIPTDCGKFFCVLSANVLEKILAAHNELVEENRRLKAATEGKVLPPPKCPGSRDI